MSESLKYLSIEQLRDLVDAKIESVGLPAYDPERFDYFDNMDEYSTVLASLGYELPSSLDHELSHGRCALAVGVIGVKYGIEYQTYSPKGGPIRVPNRAITSIMGPSQIPRIAVAAFAAAPKDPSPSDLAYMRRLSYPSLEALEARIAKWNRQDTGLIIPMPGTIDTSY